MTNMSFASIVCHTPNPVATVVAGETVLMSLERGRCYGLIGGGRTDQGRLNLTKQPQDARMPAD